MVSSLMTSIAGLVAVVALSGVGRLVIRPLRPLPGYWAAALAMVAGIGAAAVAVECLAMAGSGRAGFLLLAGLIVVVGIIGQAINHVPADRPPRAALVAGGALVALLALIALAPSSKIDELFYHMLIGRRVIEDHGLRVYMLPFEAAIVPQTGYQIAESIFHAAGTPDAGNLVAVACAAALAVLIAGVVADETGRSDIGYLAAGTALVGLYPAVWYVTAGPHAYGDLATFGAVGALCFPGRLTDARPRFLVCVVCAACAASTKISLVPVGLVLTAFAVARLAPSRLATAGAAAVAVWAIVLGPLVVWTYLHTGSPFGLAFAGHFGHTAYSPEIQQSIEGLRTVSQVGLWPALRHAAHLFNGATIVLALIGLVGCARQWRRFGPLAVAVLLQIVLIARYLPHDVRFLGGLQYGLIAVGAITVAAIPRAWVPIAALILLGPWFVAELIYARPFVSVAIGVTSPQAFRARYVALSDDWAALDTILPRNATLFSPQLRAPAADAPRPVIFALDDWDRSRPLYRLDIGRPAPSTTLTCDAPVYQNPNALIVSYRAPDTRPAYASLTVRRCRALRDQLPLGEKERRLTPGVVVGIRGVDRVPFF